MVPIDRKMLSKVKLSEKIRRWLQESDQYVDIIPDCHFTMFQHVTMRAWKDVMSKIDKNHFRLNSS